MIQYAYATKYGLENPTVQNVPSWAIVLQYPRVLGAELGRLPDCTPNLNTVKGYNPMYGMGHYNNAFEPMLTQLQQIIQFETQRKQSDASIDQLELAKAFNELQAAIAQVMTDNPGAFFAPNGQMFLHPNRGSEGAWAVMIETVLNSPVMEGALERYPQLEQFHRSMVEASGIGVMGVVAVVGVAAIILSGTAWLLKKYQRPNTFMPRFPPMSPQYPSSVGPSLPALPPPSLSPMSPLNL